jgi:excisionase family DNA binding protein
MGKEIESKDHLLDVRQAARFLGVNPGTIRRWAQSGTLKGIKVGVRGDWRFTAASLQKLMSGEAPEYPAQSGVVAVRAADAADHIETTTDVFMQHKLGFTKDSRHIPTGKYHEVQFYDNDEYLINSLKDYIVSGLKNGDICIVLIMAKHAQMLQQALSTVREVDMTEAIEKGNYQVYDAAEVLDRMMVEGKLDRARFNEVVGTLIAESAERSNRVRVYGEIVALLWSQDNLPALIQLEEYWNELAASYKFLLLCGYSMASFTDIGHQHAFAGITKQHGKVTPAESHTGNIDSSDQLRTIAALQQTAQALRHEIAARQAVVEKLEAQTTELVVEKQRLLRVGRAKDEFISIASHQLRTPATGVKQYLGMLMEGYSGELTEDQLKFLRKAYESNERQIKVVNDLLLIAKVDAGNIHLESEYYDIVRLIRDVTDEQLNEIIKRRQRLDIRVPKSLKAHLDPQYFRMVLENLISNARKYSPDETTITIAASAGKDQITVSVKDEGIGISAEDQVKLYKKFSRIYNDQSVAEGNGLGLYWSKKIVELHGGKLMLESTPGKGSKFTVALPVR